MTEIIFKGGSTHLKGQQTNEDDFAPDFTVLNSDLNQATLADYAGRKKLISVISSTDTGVYDQQTRRFNSEASKEEGIVSIASADLPFVQKKWCASVDLGSVITLSDHRDLSFGESHGVVMEELRLSARAVLVLDTDNKIIYKEIASEGADLLGFGAALTAYRNI